MRLLLIEDHKPLVRALKQGLEEEGFAVDTATDGEEGGYKAETANYDVIVLDLMLPKEDGLSLLQRWRRAGLKTHVLVLTARGEPGHGAERRPAPGGAVGGAQPDGRPTSTARRGRCARGDVARGGRGGGGRRCAVA